MQDDDSALVRPELFPRMPAGYQRRTRSFRSGQLAPQVTSRQIAPVNSNCFVCGGHNSLGLHLTFEHGSKGVEATWVPNQAWESFEGTVHGGIITTVLDEAMSKAIMASGSQAFTVSLNIRFHSRTSPGERLHVCGWVTERRKRRILTEASLVAESTIERAHAWATFLTPGNSLAMPSR
ncbi:MAG: PaaI family thioesterase [Candidatus Sulfotelmatobacter sp.]